MPTIHLLIRGRVQGVFYRASARDKARALGLTGWVKNLEDGSVEAMASGDADVLKEFGRWCNMGPSGAAVSDVTVTNVAEEKFEGFSIKRGNG
jgi:acylphosphatase